MVHAIMVGIGAALVIGIISLVGSMMAVASDADDREEEMWMHHDDK